VLASVIKKMMIAKQGNAPTVLRLANRKTSIWKKAPQESSLNFGLCISKAVRNFLLWEDLGHGADGRAFLVSGGTKGAVGVLKFFFGSEPETVKRKAQHELDMWRQVYGHLSPVKQTIRIVEVMGHKALLMPWFQCPKRTHSTLLAVEKTLTEDFMGKNFRHNDVAWRNVGVYSDGGETKAVVFDMQRVYPDTNDNGWVKVAFESLKATSQTITLQARRAATSVVPATAGIKRTSIGDPSSSGAKEEEAITEEPPPKKQCCNQENINEEESKTNERINDDVPPSTVDPSPVGATMSTGATGADCTSNKDTNAMAANHFTSDAAVDPAVNNDNNNSELQKCSSMITEMERDHEESKYNAQTTRENATSPEKASTTTTPTATMLGENVNAINESDKKKSTDGKKTNPDGEINNNKCCTKMSENDMKKSGGAAKENLDDKNDVLMEDEKEKDQEDTFMEHLYSDKYFTASDKDCENLEDNDDAKDDDFKDDDEGDEDEIQEVTDDTATPESPHIKYDQAIAQSCNLLKDLDNMLAENDAFCSEVRRKAWSKEIHDSLQRSAPNTIIGCLGSTGVGKSSLLNALLDEAAVLPTSGSRGCTAAVVELRFNRELFDITSENNDAEKENGSQEEEENTVVYMGQIELMSLHDWLEELRVNLDECCTQETQTVYARAPEEQHMPVAAAAWAKINQVYGRGTMETFVGKKKAFVWDRLAQNHRVKQLLTGENGKANTIVVEEGKVGPTDAKLLLGQLSALKGKLCRSQKKWAKGFRAKINDFVYRKGNGSEPQTWPLIRKVVLHGPWAVLSTGACLVDLPGVRDANVARARVSESYLQNCHQIWVVAPIKRAVDDGTAKELMGEQFKRRLLMDGQYGNVSFICTQTDDCETTEIMRDHEDVAKKVEGRWEKMRSMLNEISSIDKESSQLVQDEDDLKIVYEDARQAVLDLREEIKEAKEHLEDDKSAQVVTALKVSLVQKRSVLSDAAARLREWRVTNKVQKLAGKSQKLQKRLKAIAAMVRNEYSTTSCKMILDRA